MLSQARKKGAVAAMMVKVWGVKSVQPLASAVTVMV